MSERKVLSIDAFEWASVSQYIVYISGAAGLLEINSNYVVSLPLARIGPEKALAQKMKVSIDLRSNLRSLEGFVERFRSQVGSGEIAIIRGMYRQFKDNLETVEGHMEIIENYAQSSNKAMFEQSEETDDLPF